MTSILSYLRWWFPRAPTDQFMAEAARLANLVLPKERHEDALKRAGELGLEIDSRKRWDTWRELIRIDETCAEQLGQLNKCRYFVRLVRHWNLNKEGERKFVDCFSSLLEKAENLGDLDNAIKERQRGWQETRDRVHKLRPRVFVTHAFLMLSEVSGVEIATLFVGGLIGLGALYTEVFYTLAIGQSVAAYFTLDDLINQGILVLREVVVALFVMEAFFAIFRATMRLFSRRFSYVPHWWVLRHPVRMVFIASVFIASVTAASAYWGGVSVHGEFADKRPDELELATVMDGTVLQDVHLVGTTARTATFQQVRGWGVWSTKDEESRKCDGEKREESKNEAQETEDTAATIEKGADTYARLVADHGAEKVCALGPDIIIMDRALVVCHAAGKLCLEQERRLPGGGPGEAVGERTNPPGDGVTKRLEALARGVEALAGGVEALAGKTAEMPGQKDWEELQGGLNEHLNRHVGEVNSHLNRHLGHVDDKIEKMHGSLEDVVRTHEKQDG